MLRKGSAEMVRMLRSIDTSSYLRIAAGVACLIWAFRLIGAPLYIWSQGFSLAPARWVGLALGVVALISGVRLLRRRSSGQESGDSARS